MLPSPPRDRNGFEIALICALPIEADAVLATFDRFWAKEGRNYGKAPHDENEYTTGVIGHHNVVLAHMGGMGTINAAGVAASLKSSFNSIKLALVVGICGGVPSGSGPKHPIYLGDLIISTAIIQYDFGRQYPKVFEKKDTLEANPGQLGLGLRNTLGKLRTRYYTKELQIDMLSYLRHIEEEIEEAKYPGVEVDYLYSSSNLHKHHASSDLDRTDECFSHPDAICKAAMKKDCRDLGCWGRDPESFVDRNQGRSTSDHKPAIHFGRIGSGDTVMKSGVHRDQIAKNDEIIGFEMEGSGVWDHFPSLVIKGVCDYADSHKNKDWQDHAAAVAAAGMKAILKQWNPEVNVGEAGGSSAEQSTRTEANSNTPRSTVIHNYGDVANQVGRQTIHGSVYNSPVTQNRGQATAPASQNRNIRIRDERARLSATTTQPHLMNGDKTDGKSPPPSRRRINIVKSDGLENKTDDRYNPFEKQLKEIERGIMERQAVEKSRSSSIFERQLKESEQAILERQTAPDRDVRSRYPFDSLMNKQF